MFFMNKSFLIKLMHSVGIKQGAVVVSPNSSASLVCTICGRMRTGYQS